MVNTTKIEREENIIIIEITDPIIELGVGQEMVTEMVIEEMTHRYDRRPNYRRDNFSQNHGDQR